MENLFGFPMSFAKPHDEIVLSRRNDTYRCTAAANFAHAWGVDSIRVRVQMRMDVSYM